MDKISQFNNFNIIKLIKVDINQKKTGGDMEYINLPPSSYEYNNYYDNYDNFNDFIELN
jgi:hypothetical protein